MADAHTIEVVVLAACAKRGLRPVAGNGAVGAKPRCQQLRLRLPKQSFGRTANSQHDAADHMHRRKRPSSLLRERARRFNGVWDTKESSRHEGNRETIRLMNQNVVPTRKPLFERIRDALRTVPVRIRRPKSQNHNGNVLQKPSPAPKRAFRLTIDPTALPFTGGNLSRTCHPHPPARNRAESPIFLVSTRNRSHVNKNCSLGRTISDFACRAGWSQYRTNRGDCTSVVPTPHSFVGPAFKDMVQFSSPMTKDADALGHNLGRELRSAAATACGRKGNRSRQLQVQTYKTTKSIEKLLQTLSDISS